MAARAGSFFPSATAPHDAELLFASAGVRKLGRDEHRRMRVRTGRLNLFGKSQGRPAVVDSIGPQDIAGSPHIRRIPVSS